MSNRPYSQYMSKEEQAKAAAYLLTGFRTVKDFPKKGVVYKCLTPILMHPDTFTVMIELLHHKISVEDWSQIDYIAGIESRGFIIATALAIRMGKGMLLIRKKGKLPPPVVSESYELEYGTDTLEMSISAKTINDFLSKRDPLYQKDVPTKRVLIVDDILATGGTLAAAYNLTTKAGYVPWGQAVLMKIPDLIKPELKYLDNSTVSIW